MSAAVPRIARSLDELRVGQKILCFHGDESFHDSTVSEFDLTDKFGRKQMGDWFLIVKDAPSPPPILVPAEAVERLRDAVGRQVSTGPSLRVMDAVRDLLAAIEGAGE